MEELLRTTGWLAIAVYAAIIVYAAVCDLVTFEIPNWVPIGAAVAFLPAAGAAGWSMTGIAVQCGAGALVLVVGFLLYLKGFAGGGDIKLLAAVTVWSGWTALLEFLLLMSLAGGALALAVLAYRRVRLAPRLAAVGWLAKLHVRSAGIPYGVAISAAALYVLPYLPLIQALRART